MGVTGESFQFLQTNFFLMLQYFFVMDRNSSKFNPDDSWWVPTISHYFQWFLPFPITSNISSYIHYDHVHHSCLFLMIPTFLTFVIHLILSKVQFWCFPTFSEIISTSAYLFLGLRILPTWTSSVNNKSIASQTFLYCVYCFCFLLLLIPLHFILVITPNISILFCI